MNAAQAEGLLARVLGDVAPEADLATVDPDADLREVLDIDSLDFLTVVERLREETGIEVAERDYPKLASMRGCIAYLVAMSQGPS